MSRNGISSSASNDCVLPRRQAVGFAYDSPQLAATYEEVSGFQLENGRQLISALNLCIGERVLDIGAGTGRLAAYVAELVGPSGDVVAIDPLPLRIEIARTKATRNFEAHVGRAEDLSEFGDSTFDVVYLNSVFHWVADKPRALAEIFRVLKPSGRLGLNSQDTTKPHEARLFIRRALLEAGIEGDHNTLHPSLGISSEELQDLLTRAGFVACSIELRTFVDIFAAAEALIDWSSSGAFGNFLVGVSTTDRAAVRDKLARLLELKRSSEGIRLERYLIFATAQKPNQTGSKINEC